MADPIGPGDIVRCISSPAECDYAPWVFPPAPGSEWIVRGVGDCRNSGVPAVALVGDGLPVRTDHNTTPGWPLAHFRKVDRPAPPEDTAIQFIPSAVPVKEHT